MAGRKRKAGGRSGEGETGCGHGKFPFGMEIEFEVYQAILSSRGHMTDVCHYGTVFYPTPANRTAGEVGPGRSRPKPSETDPRRVPIGE